MHVFYTLSRDTDSILNDMTQKDENYIIAPV